MPMEWIKLHSVPQFNIMYVDGKVIVQTKHYVWHLHHISSGTPIYKYIFAYNVPQLICQKKSQKNLLLIEIMN